MLFVYFAVLGNLPFLLDAPQQILNGHSSLAALLFCTQKITILPNDAHSSKRNCVTILEVILPHCLRTIVNSLFLFFNVYTNAFFFFPFRQSRKSGICKSCIKQKKLQYQHLHALLTMQARIFTVSWVGSTIKHIDVHRLQILHSFYRDQSKFLVKQDKLNNRCSEKYCPKCNYL